MSEAISTIPKHGFDAALSGALDIAMKAVLLFNRAHADTPIDPVAIVSFSEYLQKANLAEPRAVYEGMGSAALSPAVVCYPVDKGINYWDALIANHQYRDPSKHSRVGESMGVESPDSPREMHEQSFLPQGWAASIITTNTDRLLPPSRDLKSAGPEEYLALQWLRLTTGRMPIDSVTTALLRRNDGRRLFGSWDGFKGLLAIRSVMPGSVTTSEEVVPRYSSPIAAA